jgi:hypothetical protein
MKILHQLTNLHIWRTDEVHSQSFGCGGVHSQKSNGGWSGLWVTRNLI